MAQSLSKTDLLSIVGRYPLEVVFPVFIETGTAYGVTIFEMENIFDNLYTIELKYEFYRDCKDKYKGNKIIFLLGDSSKLLPAILHSLRENIVFWLDAHWSAMNTAHGDKENPLLEELESINKVEGHIVIIIDDYRLFGINVKDCNWSDITEENILSKLDSKRILTTFVEFDRYVIFLDKAK
jgi:hypothetical protein